MKFFIDLLLIIGFFIVFKVSGIFIATAFTICVTIFQIIWLSSYRRKIDIILLVNLGITFIFGSATLILHNAKSIQWKQTVLYWTFSAVLIVSRYVFSNNLLEKIIGNKFPLESSIYEKLNIAWSIFFILLGSGNLYALNYYTESQWVNFKLFWTTGAMIIFVLLQSLWLKKHLKQK
ncbi:MAG: septation protein A [Burkholderia sp.]|nr:septation protein A [Burkholderia sp.]